MQQDRRQFLQWLAAGMAARAGAQPAAMAKQFLIVSRTPQAFLNDLATKELLRGLARLAPGAEVRSGTAAGAIAGEGLAFELRIEPQRFRDPQAYSISHQAGRTVFTAGGSQALLYSVFDFLERQGAFFGIDGDSYPLEPSPSLLLPEPGRPWEAAPRFAVRGLLPWPDFLNCISVYNDEDFRAYFEAMLRMRFNMFGMHVYTGASQWAESYLSFEFGGVGHLAFLDNSASHRWGYLPQRTSRFVMGAADYYDGEVFGADATRLGRDPWEIADRTRQLLRKSLDYARRLGLRTGIGFEPYQIPDEIWRALPPEVKPPELPGRHSTGARFDIESVTARKLLETRLAQLLEAYPDVDYVWLWEDEGMNWESRKTGVPLSVTPFMQAHDFLRRHAPAKRLILSGWGGVARHFDYFHQKLPMDIVFSCLSDSLGWDPVHEVFGRLEGRERWPIPWLEDDPAMWLPQFHVHRFERDLNLAEQYGCQGMLGIHWRHRIVDPTAGYLARFAWDKSLTPTHYYAAYARTQAAGGRAARLAAVLDDADKNRKLLATGAGQMKDGHVVTREFSGDYNEAFTFWNDYEPSPAIVESQKQVAAALRDIAEQAASASAAERERLEYLTRHVEFLVPYAEAWTLAHRMHLVLKKAGELKAAGQAGEARAVVASEVVPMWLRLAPRVREAMLFFQSVVATRNDLGTLASMQNKFVRLALIRLRLSIQEYLGELPAETERLFAEVTRPDPKAAARLIVPTRPSMLKPGETVRVMALATGSEPVEGVWLHVRARGSVEWQTTPAKLLGRRTYEVQLGVPATAELVEYHFTAQVGEQSLAAPPGAPRDPYLLTVTRE